jgi:hypothetical protein
VMLRKKMLVAVCCAVTKKKCLIVSASTIHDIVPHDTVECIWNHIFEC